MAWVKIDDGFPEHPKIVKAGKLAGFAQVEALCYANRNLTDGFIPLKIACGFASPRVRSKLVNVGLWDEVSDGYKIHDYSEYQPTKAQVLANRAAVTERVKRHRNAVTSAISNGVGNAPPVPVPVPVSREEEEKDRERGPLRLAAPRNETRRPTRAAPLPEPFDLTPERQAFAEAGGLTDVVLIFGAFKDFHRARGTLMKDWDAAWRSWCRKELDIRSERARRVGR